MRKNIVCCILLLFFGFISVSGQSITLATYNLRNANRADSLAGNGWGQRFPYIAGIIRFHEFDLFGTQEGLYHQLQDLKTALPGYDYIGVGRDDGKQKGEFSAIFYRTDRFEVLEHGDFWLSTITDRPNKGWDAALPRICTWGKFRDQWSGKTLLFYNLHQDHRGVQARNESVKLVLKKIEEGDEHLPVILTGDFNVDQHSEPYDVLVESGILFDSYEKATFRYAPNGTFNAFYADRKTESRIDHIFVSKEFEVKRYGILTDTYRSEDTGSEVREQNTNFPKEVSLQKYRARLPSDHFPVMIIVELNK